MTCPIWNTSDADLKEKLAALKSRLRLTGGEGDFLESARRSVQEILDAVRRDGDRAVLEFTEKFDRCRLSPEQMRVSTEEIEAAASSVEPQFLESLEFAAERIRRFQQSILPGDPTPVVVEGRSMRIRHRPVDSAGLCVPGASASLPSSVLMNAVPAKVAGVPRLAMVTPPAPDGSVSADRLAAAKVAGIDEVYRIGGAQAVGALTFGTETVPPVDFIAGPGNVYVTLAKKAVFGEVGIDMLGGPSEVVIIADSSANPQWLAADMISQAEHAPGSAVLLTNSETVALRTGEALEQQLAALPRRELATECLTDCSAVIVTESLDECVELADELAAEHLEIITCDPEALAAQVRHAGAIFLGPYTPVAVGDYVAGPSHVLPTGTTARFSSGLSATDFLKRTSLITYDRKALAEDAPRLFRIADAEGLDGHARSVRIRLEDE